MCVRCAACLHITLVSDDVCKWCSFILTQLPRGMLMRHLLPRAQSSRLAFSNSRLTRLMHKYMKYANPEYSLPSNQQESLCNCICSCICICICIRRSFLHCATCVVYI